MDEKRFLTPEEKETALKHLRELRDHLEKEYVEYFCWQVRQHLIRPNIGRHHVSSINGSSTRIHSALENVQRLIRMVEMDYRV